MTGTSLHSQDPELRQSASEDLRNAAYMAGLWALSDFVGKEEAAAFASIARLVRHALGQLGEPNEAAISVATTLLRAAMGPTAFDLAEPRLPRDTASVILNAQVTGYSPETL